MKRALKDTVITPEDKAKCAYAMYNFAELGGYLKECETSEEVLKLLKYALNTKSKYYMITRIYGRYKVLKTAEDYEDIYAYAAAAGTSDRDISKIKR
mgnify:CR=1 FL=1|jgi:hypothetical protein